MFGLGIGETIVILIAVIVVVFWLGKKAPNIAHTTGKSIAEFKQGLKSLPEEIEKTKQEIQK